MTEIVRRIQNIRQQIPTKVRLIAVTKTVSAAGIREAYAAGIRDFGENRLQDALPKIAELQDLQDVCWHYIGHLQTNKARKVLENFAWIHSVDRLSLAQHLDRLVGELNLTPKICLQVRILDDPDKYGWYPNELMADLDKLDRLSHLQIKGLMVILPLGLFTSQALEAFQATERLRKTICDRRDFDRLDLTELSMGMSGDYLQAIEAGATMIRLGTTIFSRIN
jgi:PLP dependent protein